MDEVLSAQPTSVATARNQATASGASAPPASKAGGHTVSRFDRLSDRDVIEKFLKPRIPVVLSDSISGWPALSKWSPDFFRSQYGGSEVSIRSSSYSPKSGAQPGEQHFELTELIDLVEKSTEDAPAPYLKNQAVAALSPRLMDDIRPLPGFFFPNWIEGPFTSMLRTRLDYGGPELHIGGRAAAFPSLHYDYCHVNAFLTQIYGQKTVIFFPPDQTELVYPEKVFRHGSQIPDIDHVDLARFPLFARATPMTVTIHPGDLLFVPAGWWHTTRMSSVSITATFEHANSGNWADLIRDSCFLVPRVPAMKLAMYLRLLGLFRTLRGS